MCQLDKVNAKACLQQNQTRSSRRNLTQNSAKFVKIYRLRQIEIESSFFAALDIVPRSKTGYRHGFDSSFSFRFHNNIVAIPVWQRDVTQHHVELLGLDH